MKICFVSTEGHSARGGGGLGSYLGSLAPALAARGHQVALLCAGCPDPLPGVELRCVRLPGWHSYSALIPGLRHVLPLPLRELEWSWKLAEALRDWHAEQSFDLVESAETGNLWGSLRLPGLPRVIRCHGSTWAFKQASAQTLGISERADRALQRFSLQRAAAVSVPSSWQARRLRTELRGLPAQVIPNPVAEPFFATTAEPAQEAAIRLLYSGRLARSKGVLVLIEALARLRQRGLRPRLVLAGSGHGSIPAAELRAAIRSAGVDTQLERRGHVPWQQMPALIRSCQALVAPAFHESFCLAAAEAMACGLPVVGTRGTALEELIADEETGLLVPQGDSDALADALERLCRDSSQRTTFGSEGRKRAQVYRADRIAAISEQFYAQVLARAGR